MRARSRATGSTRWPIAASPTDRRTDVGANGDEVPPLHYDMTTCGRPPRQLRANSRNGARRADRYHDPVVVVCTSHAGNSDLPLDLSLGTVSANAAPGSYADTYCPGWALESCLDAARLMWFLSSTKIRTVSLRAPTASQLIA